MIFEDGHRPLTAAQQFNLLKHSVVTNGYGELSPGQLQWRFEAQPTSLSRVYELELDFRQGSRPRVFVMDQDVVSLAGGRRLPHVYREDPVELCLYVPRARQWAPWMPLDRSVVPWAVLWLYYFEDWLATDEWHGGGLHPADFSRRALGREGVALVAEDFQ